MEGLSGDPKDAWNLFQNNYRQKYENELIDLGAYIPEPEVYAKYRETGRKPKIAGY